MPNAIARRAISVPIRPIPKYTDRFAVKFDALVALSIPLTGLHAGVRLRNIPRDRNQQGKSMLCRGDGIAARGVHDDHPAARCRVHIHIVDADSCPANEPSTVLPHRLPLP